MIPFCHLVAKRVSTGHLVASFNFFEAMPWFVEWSEVQRKRRFVGMFGMRQGVRVRFCIRSSCLAQPLNCWDHGCVSLHTDQYAVLPWHSFPYSYMLWCGLNLYIFYLFVLWMSPTVYLRIASNAWAQAHVCLRVAEEAHRSHGVQLSLKCASLCPR